MAANLDPSTILEEINILLLEYFAINPEADNPLDFVYVLGLDGVLNVLKEANNREIVFNYVYPDEDHLEYTIIDP